MEFGSNDGRDASAPQESYLPVAGPDGFALALESVAQELMEFQRRHGALRRRSEILQAIVEATPDILFAKDLTGRYLWVNSAAARALGRRAADVVGCDDLALFGRADGARIRKLDRELMALGEPRTFEQDVVIGDQRATWLTTKVPLYDEDGSTVGLLGFARDITGQMAAASERERKVAELEAAVRSRDDFLAVAAHELKNPVGALRLSMESTLRQARGMSAHGPDEKTLPWIIERMEVATRQLHRLSRQVASLLDASRSGAGQFELDPVPMDLAELAREVVHRCEEDVSRSGSKVKVEAPAGVPGVWDRYRLEQVVGNLLSNALKYGAGRPVEISVDAHGDQAILQVKDQGIGIPKEHQPRIFDRFERAPGAKAFPGTGLGLWIVRSIVEAHGGDIQVKSVLGQGSTFTVRLPSQRSH